MKRHIHILCSKKVLDVPLIIDSDSVNSQYEITRGPTIAGRPWLVYCETGIFDIEKYLDQYNCGVFIGGNYWIEFADDSQRLERVERILRRCHVVVCISQYMSRVVKSKLNIGNVAHLPGGMWGLPHLGYKVNPHRFVKKQTYEITGRPIVALCVSLAIEQKYKGLIHFLRSVRDIAEKHDVQYVCYGRMKGRDDLLWKIKKAYKNFEYHHWARQGDTYDFTSGLGDLKWPEALNQSDLYVHPSYLDTWGCAIADAMCTGVPALVYNMLGPMEVGNTYVKINPKRVDILRKMFEKLLLSADYRKKVGESMYKEMARKMIEHRDDFVNLLNKIG